jgi:excinuclease ABC subunit C
MQKNELQKYNLPDAPGVYLFKQGRKVLYVGKATSLRDRVRSYFDDDLIATRGPRVVDMVTKADRVTHEATATVLEALVREAAIIKKYHPSANVEGKDDSTFLYAVITKEEIPRVLVLRGKDIDFKARKTRSNLKSESSRFDLVFRSIYGPFPSGAQLRDGLRLIRRIFQFFDTQKPVGAKGKHQAARIEFNTQIKQYPRGMRFTLASPIGQDKVKLKIYRQSIRKVGMFLSGRGRELRAMLEREMRRAAKEERFEDAVARRRELFALDHIQDVSLIKQSTDNIQQTTELGVGGQRLEAARIEAYDTAHLSGTSAIGVMAVVQDGTPTKSEYRTFNIRGVTKNDDIASLKEVLLRRIGHSEWQLPKAIVVDGGTTHKKAAESVLVGAGISVPVVAVVKDERHRPREVIGARRAGVGEADAVFANSEAHRFSLARHRSARSRSLRGK